MAGRETADIVFCIDASSSMASAIDGVKKNIKKLVDSLESTPNTTWDVRFDFLAYSNVGVEPNYRLESVKINGKDLLNEVYAGDLKSGSKLFTSDVEEFKNALNNIRVEGDETTIPALDIAADFPFRDASTCHRAIVLLTDEVIDTGCYKSKSREKLMDLAQKLQNRKIALYMVTPNCDEFDTLSQVDRCEWNICTSDGMEDIDFSKLMQRIGRSVSMSQTQGTSKIDDSPKPLFNESKWHSSGGRFVEIDI